jgi:hypothetical protein
MSLGEELLKPFVSTVGQHLASNLVGQQQPSPATSEALAAAQGVNVFTGSPTDWAARELALQRAQHALALCQDDLNWRMQQFHTQQAAWERNKWFIIVGAFGVGWLVGYVSHHWGHDRRN